MYKIFIMLLCNCIKGLRKNYQCDEQLSPEDDWCSSDAKLSTVNKIHFPIEYPELVSMTKSFVYIGRYHIRLISIINDFWKFLLKYFQLSLLLFLNAIIFNRINIYWLREVLQKSQKSFTLFHFLVYNSSMFVCSQPQNIKKRYTHTVELHSKIILKF